MSRLISIGLGFVPAHLPSVECILGIFPEASRRIALGVTRNTYLISIYDPVNDGYERIRRDQFQRFVEWSTAKTSGEPLVLGGDFNFGPQSAYWSEAKATVLKDFSQSPGAESQCTVCPPNSMHTENEGKLDHLFFSAGLETVSGGPALNHPVQVQGSAGVFLSDHFGFESTARLKGADVEENSKNKSIK